jgi:DNA-binding SARP family transcriptional activator
MDFRILGPLEVLDEGRVVPLGGRRQRVLLTLLLLHVNETLSMDRLIDELWGERPPATADKTIYVQISRLRKALAPAQERRAEGEGVVVTHGRGYRLALDRECIDAHRFEQLVAEGGRELAAGRPERAARVLDRALALWRGAALADAAYEPFAQADIKRLHELRASALEQRIETDLALGRHADVVGRLPALIAEHPYREHLRAQLMLALYRFRPTVTRGASSSTCSASSPGSGCASSSAPFSRRIRRCCCRPTTGARPYGSAPRMRTTETRDSSPHCDS